MIRLPVQLLYLPVAAIALVAGCKEEGTNAEIRVPSGREVSLIDVITNAPGPEGATARFRFLAPGLSDAETETAVTDMQALCDSYALPRTKGTVPEPQQIVISLSAEPVPFGEAAPEVVQFFEAFRPEGDSCIWEPF